MNYQLILVDHQCIKTSVVTEEEEREEQEWWVTATPSLAPSLTHMKQGQDKEEEEEGGWEARHRYPSPLTVRYTVSHRFVTTAYLSDNTSCSHFPVHYHPAIHLQFLFLNILFHVTFNKCSSHPFLFLFYSSPSLSFSLLYSHFIFDMCFSLFS